MSHLAPANLLGGGGGGSDTGDFDFADMPEDDEDEVPPDYEFDAVNDETFGMDVETVAHTDFEMEHYAEQTAHLAVGDDRASTSQIQLGDNGQLWVQAMLEASVSNLLADADDAPSAPPAHYLPMPAFGDMSGGFSPGAKPARQRLERFMDNVNQSTAPAPFFLDIGTVDTIWGKSGGMHSPEKPNGTMPAIRTDMENRSIPPSADENRAPSNLSGNQILALLQQMQLQEQQRAAAGRSPLRGAVTLEEVERQTQSPSQKPRTGPMTLEELERSILQKQQPTQTPPKPPMTVEELERRLRMQTGPPPNLPRPDRQPQSPSPVNAPPPGIQQLQQARYPPMNVPPPLWMNPQVRAAIMAHIAAGKPLPPGFPPPGAFMRSPMGPPPLPGQRMPPNRGPLPSGGMPPPPSQWGSLGRPPMGMPQRPPGAHLIRMQPMNQYFREQQLKRAGLPSGKTISDFAFDPYAGLMSRKEREWLVKIQGLQLQGSGNPYNDDYYYTLWKQKKSALERQELGLKPLHASELETEHTETTPYNYVPPTFAGSLGKPTLSTANNPRQLITLCSRHDSVNDDNESTTGSSSAPTPTVAQLSGHRRFKALLIEVEHGWTLLLECEERYRQLAAGTVEEANRALMASEIRIRLAHLCESLCGQRLSSVVSLKKGRELLSRVVRQADKDESCKLISDFVAQLVALGKKDGAGEIQSTLFPAIYDAFKRLTKEHLVTIWEHLTVDTMRAAFATKNMFPQSVLLLLVSYSARKRLPSSGSLPMVDWLQLASSPAIPALTSVPWLSTDHVKIMRHWLVGVIGLNEVAVDQYISTLSVGL